MEGASGAGEGVVPRTSSVGSCRETVTVDTAAEHALYARTHAAWRALRRAASEIGDRSDLRAGDWPDLRAVREIDSVVERALVAAADAAAAAAPEPRKFGADARDALAAPAADLDAIRRKLAAELEEVVGFGAEAAQRLAEEFWARVLEDGAPAGTRFDEACVERVGAPARAGSGAPGVPEAPLPLRIGSSAPGAPEAPLPLRITVRGSPAFALTLPAGSPGAVFAAGVDPPRRIAAVALRYAALNPGGRPGQQLAWLDAPALLADGFTFEAFASPLNAELWAAARKAGVPAASLSGAHGSETGFCSLFPALDCSLGPFWTAEIPPGSGWHVNPPFVEAILARTAARVLGALDDAAAAGTEPPRFHIVFPAWPDAEGYRLLEESGRFARETARFPFLSDGKEVSVRVAVFRGGAPPRQDVILSA